MKTLMRPLGQILLGEATISAEELAQALSVQATHGGRLGGILVRLGALSEESLLAALSRQTGYPLADYDMVANALGSCGPMPEGTCGGRCIVWRDLHGRLCAGSSDPLDSEVQETVTSAFPHEQIVWHFLGEAHQERLAAARITEEPGELDSRQLRELAEDAPVIALVNNLIAQAIDERASDVHVEPGERELDVRFRIDGVLHPRLTAPMQRFAAIASRIKLIAGLDIAERRLPQDGRISLRAAGTELDLRVSTIPAVHGESIVMRLLPKTRSAQTLMSIGMAQDHLALFGEWLATPNGLILVTGPTGSGKSTTLYSALAAINDRSRKIVTVEDPVEFRLPHMVQIQVQSDIGYGFARALRAILRHDPDIIMIGEIRDRETAEIAVQAALTGHLVLATLHTNDALSAFTRLVDMGIEPYLVAAATRAVMAQRLVRRLCPACAEPVPAPEEWREKLAAARPSFSPEYRIDEEQWRTPNGCGQCRHTGFLGRVGIYELVDVNQELRHAIAELAPQALLEQIVATGSAGCRPLLLDGLMKCATGATALEEVLRATQGHRR